MTSADATLLDLLARELDRAGRWDEGAVERPAAVLWCDASGEWLPLVRRLRAHLPLLLSYGDWEPAERTGPAIWLKCVLAGAIGDQPLAPDGPVPIVYLPEVARTTLRAGEDCPVELQPLVELQHRGEVWKQPKNGRDWTVEAFLVKVGGLEVAADAATREALRRGLVPLFEQPAVGLAAKRIDTSFLDRLVAPDPERDLLLWLSNPRATRAGWDEGRWNLFRKRCRDDFGFDPEKDGELVGVERLAEGATPACKRAWTRFEEAPSPFAGLVEVLDRVEIGLLHAAERYPRANRLAEGELRVALGKLEAATASKARAEVLALEEKHGARRRTVWARLGHSPLAEALGHLVVLARATEKLPGGGVAQIAEAWAAKGWHADAALLAALAAVKTPPDARAVQAAARALWLPWADELARRFQAAVAKERLPESPPAEADPGTVVLFADGLRLDLARGLADRLRRRGLEVAEALRFAALPTVTATAKPAVAPLPMVPSGGDSTLFTPALGASLLSTDRFRRALRDAGVTVLVGAEVGDPDRCAWTEAGRIDRGGHDLGGQLIHRLDQELDDLVHRVRELLDTGWRRVRIVTDHGWLLLPGGLPKIDLPNVVAASRWARCALPKLGASVDMPMVAWRWDPLVTVATAPGIAAFYAGIDYAHGGISPQECVLLDLDVTPGSSVAAPARIREVGWRGLRCIVQVEGAGDIMVDLRDSGGRSALAAPVALATDGHVSFLVADEDLEGKFGVILLLDGAGSVVARREIKIGG